MVSGDSGLALLEAPGFEQESDQSRGTPYWACDVLEIGHPDFACGCIVVPAFSRSEAQKKIEKKREKLLLLERSALPKHWKYLAHSTVWSRRSWK